MNSGLTVKNLTIGHGGKILAQVDELTLTSGSLTVLTGPNGGGKTTMLKSLAGIHPSRSGSISFQGRPLGPRDSWYLGQEPLGLEDLTVQENLDLIGGLLRESRSEWAVRRDLVIAYWDLEDHRHHLYRDLSTGFKKRCDLSLVLLAPRPCLFLDEPFNGLDAASFTRLVTLLGILKQKGILLLLASHGEVALAGLPDRFMTVGGGTWGISDQLAEGAGAPVVSAASPELWSWLTL